MTICLILAYFYSHFYYHSNGKAQINTLSVYTLAIFLQVQLEDTNGK